VEFTGLIAGDSVITATLDGTESKALVRVRAVEAGEDLLKWRMPKTLYVKYLNSGHTADETQLGEWTTESWFTGTEYEYIMPEKPNGFVTTLIEYHSASAKWRYCMNDNQAYFWEDFNGWSDSKDGNPIDGGREAYSYWGEEINPGGSAFEPLNAFAQAILMSAGHIRSPITQYRQSGKHETILNVSCEVFVVDGDTFWVDPATHYTLKAQYSDGITYEVLEYDANYSGGVPYAPGEELKLP
jgi:hypothetical protein